MGRIGKQLLTPALIAEESATGIQVVWIESRLSFSGFDVFGSAHVEECQVSCVLVNPDRSAATAVSLAQLFARLPDARVRVTYGPSLEDVAEDIALCAGLVGAVVIGGRAAKALSGAMFALNPCAFVVAISDDRNEISGMFALDPRGQQSDEVATELLIGLSSFGAPELWTCLEPCDVLDTLRVGSAVEFASVSVGEGGAIDCSAEALDTIRRCDRFVAFVSNDRNSLEAARRLIRFLRSEKPASAPLVYQTALGYEVMPAGTAATMRLVCAGPRQSMLKGK